MTVNIDASVDDNGLVDRLDQATNSVIPRQLADLLKAVGEGAIEVVKVYPPVPTHKGYKYVRTGELQSRWGYDEQSVGPEEVVGLVHNRTDYAGWLHHEEMQVPWARERDWPTIQSALRAQVGEGSVSGAGEATVSAIDIADDVANVIVDFISGT